MLDNLRIRDGWYTKITRSVGSLMKYPTGFLRTQMPWNFIATNKPKMGITADGQQTNLSTEDLAKSTLLGEKIYHAYRAGRFQFLKELDDVSDETTEMKNEYWKFVVTEPAFSASLWTKIISVISNQVIIQPSSKSPYDRQMADWVKECLMRSSGGLRKIGQEIFYHGLVRGNVLCEPKWKVKKAKKWEHLFPHGYWTLKDFVAKDPKDYRLEEDGFRNLTGVWSARTNQWFPMSYFVFWANRPIYGNQAGTSEARSIRRAATLLKLAHTYRGIYLEQFGLPILKGTYTRGDDTAYTLAYAALQRARSMGFVLMPDGADVEALSIATRGQSDYGEAIDDYRKEIFLAVTGSYLYAMEGNVGNAAGNSETHRSTLDIVVWYLSKILEEILNEQIIPWLVGLNVYDGEPPTAQIGGVQDGDLKASMEIDMNLFNMGVPLDKDELYERYRRTPPKVLEDAIKKTEPQQQPQMGGMGGGMQPLQSTDAPSFTSAKFAGKGQTTNYTCGPVALLHALTLHGKAAGLSELQLATEIGTSKEDGTTAAAIIRGAQSHGLTAEGKGNMSLNELAMRVASGSCVITSIQLKDSPDAKKQANTEGHWVVVKSVNPESGSVTYFDPSGGVDRTVDLQEFASDWHDTDAEGRLLSRYGIDISQPQDGEEMSSPEAYADFANADGSDADALKKKLKTMSGSAAVEFYIGKDGYYHGKNPPSGWILVGTGPKGGQLWKAPEGHPGKEPTYKPKVKQPQVPGEPAPTTPPAPAAPPSPPTAQESKPLSFSPREKFDALPTGEKFKELVDHLIDLNKTGKPSAADLAEFRSRTEAAAAGWKLNHAQGLARVKLMANKKAGGGIIAGKELAAHHAKGTVPSEAPKTPQPASPTAVAPKPAAEAPKEDHSHEALLKKYNLEPTDAPMPKGISLMKAPPTHSKELLEARQQSLADGSKRNGTAAIIIPGVAPPLTSAAWKDPENVKLAGHLQQAHMYKELLTPAAQQEWKKKLDAMPDEKLKVFGHGIGLPESFDAGKMREAIGASLNAAYVKPGDVDQRPGWTKPEADSGGMPSELKGTPTDKMKALAKMQNGKPPITKEEKAAINHYTGSGYAEMNDALRSQGYDKLPATQKKRIDLIHGVLEKASFPTDATTHRGMRMSMQKFNEIAQNFKEGNIFTDNGFVSTSFNASTAKSFSSSGGKAIQFVIDVPKGAKALGLHNELSGHHHETEVLLQRGTRFEIHKFEDEGPGFPAKLHVKVVV